MRLLASRFSGLLAGHLLPSLCLLLPASLCGQDDDFLVRRREGPTLLGRPAALRGAGAERVLVLKTGQGEVGIPWSEILSLHGAAPAVLAPVGLYLVGGGELKGELRGGDEQGDTLLLQSAVCGAARVPVDRLATLIQRARAGNREPLAFLLPDATGYDEAVFLPARRGLDRVGGEIERFTSTGVEFVPVGAAEPRLIPYAEMVAVAIRGGIGPKASRPLQIISDSGEVLRVELVAVAPATFGFESEFGRIELPQARLAALTVLGGGHRFLSDDQPVRVAEGDSDAGPGAVPLYPWRADRTATGGQLAGERGPADGFLVVDGRTYGKGLGVHAPSVLTFRVPPGMTRFHTWAGIDDEVESLGVKGDADVSIRLGAELLAEKKGLRAGQPPHDFGLLRVTPGALLTLEVGLGKAMFVGDRVDWLAPVFLP